MGFIHAPSTGGLALTFPVLTPAWEGGLYGNWRFDLTFPELLDFQRSDFGAQQGLGGPQLTPVPWDIVGFIFQVVCGRKGL